MLAYVLALVIGIGSLGIYIAAFFFPEVHRKQDFFWSGVGLLYALVLWVCAGRITGGVLLGQMASVALLGWFGWETLTLRRAIASPDEQTPLPNQDQLQAKLKNISPAASIGGLQQRVTGMFRKGKSQAKTPEKPAVTKVSSSPEVTVIDATTTEKAKASEQVKEATAATVTPSANEEAPTLDVTIVEEVIEVTEEVPTGEATIVEVIEVTDEPDAEVVTLVGFAEVTDTSTSEMSETPELIRPNPPDPELVKEAIASTPENAHLTSQPTLPIEEVAPEVELAPPAEPPGLGGTEDRKTDVEPENPSKPT
ncbi:MAG: Ycf66 family protein [Potamolinea sp.]